MRVLTAVFAILLSMSSVARADDVASARSVIQSQADAFSRNDSDAAYSFAAPLIREMFPQADVFMEMVRRGYAPVYRHKRFDFAESTTTDDGTIVQHIAIVDDDDGAWEAVYTLQKQPDGSLKITSCTLKKLGTAV